MLAKTDDVDFHTFSKSLIGEQTLKTVQADLQKPVIFKTL
jgi:hypothetical protein